jgi:hypothetical protein
MACWRRVRSLIAIGCLMGVSVFVLSPTSAFASCNPGRAYNGIVYYFDGMYSPYEVSGEATADSANIYNYAHPYVYPGNGDFAWVMLVDESTNYVQVGWVNDPGRDTFTEWTIKGSLGGSDFAITPQAQGTTSWYEVDTDGSGVSTDYCFFVNGSEVGGCTGIIGWFAEGGQDFDEIHTIADQMPGAVDQPEVWSNSFLFDNGSQENFNGTLDNYDPAIWNGHVYSSTMAQVGDAACTGT